MSSSFIQKLERRWAQGLFVCVGLDPRVENLPKSLIDEVIEDFAFNADFDQLSFKFQCNVAAKAIYLFNVKIINTTHDLALAFKPNLAFYIRWGPEGLRALMRTMEHIRSVGPDVPVIVDAKVADIGSTNEGYVDAILREIVLMADAVTLHPYLGEEALRPFLEQKDKGCIVLCRTSNPGAGELQDLVTLTFDPAIGAAYRSVDDLIALIQQDAMPLYQRVAKNVAEHWNENGNCALVVGATYPKELGIIRKIVGDMTILIPGIGAQGGDLEAAVRYGMDSRGFGMIINSSRGVIFACKDRSQPLWVFAQNAREEVQRLTREINRVRFEVMRLSGDLAVLADMLFACGAVKFGSFRMKIHEQNPDAPKSPHYFNLRVPENNGPLTADLVGRIGLQLHQMAQQNGIEYDLVAGLPKAGDPFASVVSVLAEKPRLKLIKETDGSRRWIDCVDADAEELSAIKNKTVLVVDDLVTGADTKLEGARVLRNSGLIVHDVVVLIDRRPSGEDALAHEELRLHAVFTQAELLNHYLASGAITPDQHARSHLYDQELAAFLQGV